MAKPKKDTNSINHMPLEEWEEKSKLLEGWSLRTHKLLKDVLVHNKNVKDLSKEYDVSRQYVYKTVSRFKALLDEKTEA